MRLNIKTWVMGVFVGAVLAAPVIVVWHHTGRQHIDAISSHGSCARTGVDDLFGTYARESGTALVLAHVDQIEKPVQIRNDPRLDGRMNYTPIDVQVSQVLSGTLTSQGKFKVYATGGTVDGLSVDADPLAGITTDATTLLVLHPGVPGLVIGNSYASAGDRLILDGLCQQPGKLAHQKYSAAVPMLANGKAAPDQLTGYTVKLNDLTSLVRAAK